MIKEVVLKIFFYELSLGAGEKIELDYSFLVFNKTTIQIKSISQVGDERVGEAVVAVGTDGELET